MESPLLRQIRKLEQLIYSLQIRNQRQHLELNRLRRRIGSIYWIFMAAGAITVVLLLGLAAAVWR